MTKLKVCFVSQGGSHLASHRMRVLKPAELLNVGVDNIESYVSNRAIMDVNVNVFNKHFSPKENFVELQAGKTKGYLTVFDICDDHFDKESGEYYKAMCLHADAITCNTKNMKKRIKDMTGRDAIVIPDPITFDYAPPVIPEGNPKFLWYGHGSNVNTLLPWLDYVDNVTIISNVGVTHPVANCMEWKPRIVESAICDHDIVLVPTTQEEWAKCKSPNRVVDAIQAGKFVITDGKEIYKDLSDFIYTIKTPEDLPEAISYWKNNPELVKEIITKGQKYISKRYSDDVILDGWLSVLKQLGLVESYKEAS